MIETFEQWEARRRYDVIRHYREADQYLETAVETDLSWNLATQTRDRLQAAEREANPRLSCWSMDIFTIRLKTPWVPAAKQTA